MGINVVQGVGVFGAAYAGIAVMASPFLIRSAIHEWEGDEEPADMTETFFCGVAGLLMAGLWPLTLFAWLRSRKEG